MYICLTADFVRMDKPKINIIDPLAYISEYTPVGMICSLCGRGMSPNNKNWKHHMRHVCEHRQKYLVKDYYPNLNIRIQKNIESSKLKAFSNHLPSQVKFQKRVQCIECNYSNVGMKKFLSRHNAEKCNCNETRIVKFVQLKCGHWIQYKDEITSN